MRSDDQPIPEEAVGFNFHFQIANGAGRTACSVRVQAHNFHDARGFFHQNWPTIELMARESLTSAAEGAEIRLILPPSAQACSLSMSEKLRPVSQAQVVVAGGGLGGGSPYFTARSAANLR